MTAREMMESLDFPTFLRNRGITVPDDAATELRNGTEPDRCSAYGALYVVWRALYPVTPGGVRGQQRRARWYQEHGEPDSDAIRPDLLDRLKRAAAGVDEPTSPAGALGRLLFGPQEETGEAGQEEHDEQG